MKCPSIVQSRFAEVTLFDTMSVLFAGLVILFNLSSCHRVEVYHVCMNQWLHRQQLLHLHAAGFLVVSCQIRHHFEGSAVGNVVYQLILRTDELENGRIIRQLRLIYHGNAMHSLFFDW